MDTGTTTPSPAAPVAGDASEAPSQARKGRAAAIVGAALLLVLLSAFLAVTIVNQTVFGPDKPVGAYLDALVAGDAERSRSLIGGGAETGVGGGAGGDAGPATADVLLSDAVYRPAAGRLTGYQVQDVTVDGDTATVLVDLKQDGTTTRSAFTLTRTGRAALVLDEWRLDGPEPVRDIDMVVPEGLRTLTVNGVEVALPAGEAAPYAGLRSMTVPALPGRYVVTPPAPSTYLSFGGTQRVTVPVDPRSAPGGVLLEAEPTPAAEAEAVSRVTAVLTACIASTDAAPAGCPNRSYLFGDPQDVRDPRWTLDREPTFSLEESYEPGVYRLTSDDAQATFSYERNTEFDRSKPPRWIREEDPRTLLLTATVTVTAEELRVDVDPAR